MRGKNGGDGGFHGGDAFFHTLELRGRQGGRIGQCVDESVDGFEEREFCKSTEKGDVLSRGRSSPNMRLMSFRESRLDSRSEMPRDLPFRSWETPEMIWTLGHYTT